MADNINQADANRFRNIVEDLNYIFTLEEIDVADVDNVISRLKTSEAKSYIQHLFEGSKPEAALREAFFAGDSVLGKYFYGYASAPPEVSENGFIDYKIKDQLGHIIVLELKSLFDSKKERDKAGRRIVKKLKQERLDWKSHKDQIKRYIGDGDYVILTNLKEWVFFSRSLDPEDPRPFYSATLAEFVREYEVIRNLKDYADRKADQLERYELDKKFLESLKGWVKKLSEVEFNVSEKRKLELIIGLIDKFIFIQTLDDYGAIEFKWIQKKWSDSERDWISKGKMRVLRKFMEAVNEFFFSYYDTELFKENFLDYVKDSEENIDRLYNNFKMVLGLTYLSTSIGFMGIMQYNFRLIDEDVLGKAYETFLAEQRKEQGAYYTPKYITEYIVENTVGRLYDGILEEIRAGLNAEDFDKVLELVKRFTSVKVLDPACGSASFLIKALRKIKEKYDRLNEIIKEAEQKYLPYFSSWESAQKVQGKLDKISEIRRLVGSQDSRELLSQIILRHIYGNDLDMRALEVAKVNIWLEAVKLAPVEFRFDRLPKETEHVLPDLRANFGNGDSLVGMRFDDAIACLANYKSMLSELSRLRREYLNNPSDPNLVEKIEEIKRLIREDLNIRFREILAKNRFRYTVKGGEKRESDLTKLFELTKPFHWCLEFWYAFFDESGEPLAKGSGFDIVIGNPPYGRIKQLLEGEEEKHVYSRYYDLTYSYQRGNYNFYKLFLERSFQLLKEDGYFSMIFPTSFLGEQDSQALRKLFFEKARILNVLQFPEKTRVFQDVTQDVIVLVYRKTQPNTDYSFKVKTNISDEELKKLDRLDYLELKVSEIREIAGEDYKIPTFVKPKEEWAILEKISRIPPFKGNDKVPSVGEVGVGHLDETFDESFLSMQPTGDLVVKGIHLDQYFVNLDPDGPQPRWVKKEAFLEKKKEAGENIKYERIIGRNTINRAMRPRLKFALLQSGIVITNAIKYIIPRDVTLDKYYVIGLLNSSVLNWRFELFSSQNNIRNYEIEGLPFYRADAEGQQAIVDKVKKIIDLKKARYMWFKIWKYWQNVMKTREKTLYDILLQDINLFRYGEAGDSWVSRPTIHPGSKNEILDKKFDRFEVIGEGRKLKIYGLQEDSCDLVEEIEFVSEKLQRIVYASTQLLLESSQEVSTLSQLLKKTKIPLIYPYEKRDTVNILSKVEEEFNRWKDGEKIAVATSDIVEIDNEIRSLVAEADACVFKLYGLDKGEAQVILDSLKIDPLYRQTVLKLL
jgi:Alw26I/Eco31I/Esp3I family type II restriction m6 adenine DNA methyltransferase